MYRSTEFFLNVTQIVFLLHKGRQKCVTNLIFMGCLAARRHSLWKAVGTKLVSFLLHLLPSNLCWLLCERVNANDLVLRAIRFWRIWKNSTCSIFCNWLTDTVVASVILTVCIPFKCVTITESQSVMAQVGKFLWRPSGSTRIWHTKRKAWSFVFSYSTLVCGFLSSDLPTPFRVGWMELQTPTLPFLSLWPMANSRWSRGIPSRISKIRKGIMKAPVMDKKKKASCH